MCAGAGREVEDLLERSVGVAQPRAALAGVDRRRRRARRPPRASAAARPRPPRPWSPTATSHAAASPLRSHATSARQDAGAPTAARSSACRQAARSSIRAAAQRGVDLRGEPAGCRSPPHGAPATTVCRANAGDHRADSARGRPRHRPERDRYPPPRETAGCSAPVAARTVCFVASSSRSARRASSGCPPSAVRPAAALAPRGRRRAPRRIGTGSVWA